MNKKQNKNNLNPQKIDRNKLFAPFVSWLNERGLRFKLMFVVGSLTLIVMVVLSVLLYNLQRQQLVENAQNGTAMVSTLLEANLRHAMLTYDRDMVNDILVESMQNPNVRSIKILNGEGTVKYSTNPFQVETTISIQEEACQNCHAVADPSTDKTVVIQPTNRAEIPFLLNVNLITNEPACYDCHDSKDRILGLLMVEMSLSGVYSLFSNNFWKIALIVFLATLSIILLLIPVLEHRVIQPVYKLKKGIEGINRGALDYSVASAHHDEIGDLARSFDQMRNQLKNSDAQRDQREQELAILYQVGLTATQLHDVNKIMEYALDTVVNKFGMADSLIFLWNEEDQKYTVRASHGISSDQIDEINRRRQAGFDFIQQVAETGNELFIPNVSADDRVDLIWQEKDRSYISFPLMSRGRVLGVMETVSRNGVLLSLHEVEFLKAIGRQIGSAIDTAKLLADTHQSEKEAQLLYTLGTSISSSLALREVLDRVAAAAIELIKSDVGLVALADENYSMVEVRAAIGEGAAVYKGKRNSVAKGTQGYQLVMGKPIFSHDIGATNTLKLDSLDPPVPEVKAFLTVPMILGEKFYGCIEVMRFHDQKFSNNEAKLISRLANHVVVVIENAMLYRQLRYVAALEEQGRLARELHDHLAQSLGFLNIKASLTDDLLTNQKLEEAHESLLELKRVTKSVYMDVREGIFNLRTTASTVVGFFPTLRAYLKEYSEHYGLEVRIEADVDPEIELSPEVANQLMRIIQEALTNVRKHAQATIAWVRCQLNKETIIIRVEDNGEGFTFTNKGENQHYGLQIMKERAESVGGTVQIESQPGKGTCVIIEAPFLILE